MYKKSLVKSIALMLALNLSLMGSAFAASTNSNPQSNFNPQSNRNFSSGMMSPGNSAGNANLGKAATYVINQGIMKGDGKGNYEMTNNIKRADLTVMIVRALKLSAQNSGNFSDVASGSYYYDAIATAKSMGIAKGDGTNFNPLRNVTLEEAIALIERAATASDNVAINSDVDLESLFSGESLSRTATREDIANLLYALLNADETADTSGTAANRLGSITYSTTQDEEITFDDQDFIDAFADASGDDLSYVKFTLPSSSYGKLYYNYESSSNYDSVVKSTVKYFAASAPYLSKVTFVPNTDYEGTVNLSYTACNDNGTSYNGTIQITVTEADDETELTTISYTTEEDEAVSFSEDDFIDALADITDNDLSYVEFTPPSSSDGTLYYNYESSSDYDSEVDSSTGYYIEESPYLSNVSFVPDSDFSGTVSIDYTAYDDDGDSYTGAIEITVE